MTQFDNLNRDNHRKICQYLNIDSIKLYKSVTTTIQHMLNDILAIDVHTNTIASRNKRITLIYHQYKYLIADSFDPISLSFRIDYSEPTEKKPKEYVCNITSVDNWKVLIYCPFPPPSNYMYYIFVNRDGKARYLISIYCNNKTIHVLTYTTPVYLPLIQLMCSSVSNYLCKIYSVSREQNISASLHTAAVYNNIRHGNILSVLQYCTSILPQV
jgi:hypothetical protein